MRNELTVELYSGILPFWEKMLGDGSRLLGRIDGEGNPHPETEIGAVMAFRMLWAFSAAARVAGDFSGIHNAKDAADRTFRYVREHFMDREHGGVWWSLSPDGQPLQRKKQSYAIGFAIYALSEYAMLCKNAEAREMAESLFNDLETHAWDAAHGGYVEALSEDWRPLGDMRLSDKDENTVFSMNTHLHIIEPYTNLYRLTASPAVKKAIERLLGIFTEKIYSNDGHLGLFFDESWKRTDSIISYGHDIEAAWLLDEAMEVIGCEHPGAREMSLTLACNTLKAVQNDGSLIYERDFRSGKEDMERHWWVQCEAAIGFYNHYQKTWDEAFLKACLAEWNYIKTRLVDRTNGEWFWSILPDGSPNRLNDRAGFWKCPYHNSRMCLELLRRLPAV